MAKIQNVDYKAMPKQAKQMRTYGKDLNKEMTTAYTSIENMHSYWYGKRYNALVKEFNKLAPKINEMLTLVVTEIPYTLEKIANNYSQADEGKNATTASKETAKKLATIKESNDVGMKFITTNVENTQTKVSSNFKNAKSIMDKIDAEYKKIKWSSEASEAFKKKFNTLKINICSSFENIQKDFKTLMDQTRTDIQKAENANTVQ